MNWAEIPFKLKSYIILLASLATPIFLWGVWRLCTDHYDDFGFVLLAVFALFTIVIFLSLPHLKAAITVGDSYIMAIAMMYGLAPCVVATFIYILIVSIVSQKSQKQKVCAHRVIFNVASTTCGAWIYGSIYEAINQGSVKPADIVIPAAILTFTFFLFNSLSTSIAIAWSLGESVFKFWVKTCLPLSLDYSLSGMCAALMATLYHPFGWWVPIAAAPVIGVVWGWNQINKNMAREALEHLKEQEQLHLRTVESLALAVDAKDQTTYGHIRRVKVYAMGLAKLCGIKDPAELKAIETGSLLHDIGKLAIDDYILNKPGRLSKKEFEKIKVHATAGDEILQPVRFPFPVAKYVRYHHERWDGLGYPDGLKGEDIPLGARILAISDAFDAIRFSRPYKLPVAKDEAAEILRNQAGIVYDPHLVQLFTRHIDELDEQAIKESETAPKLSFRKYFESIESADGVSAQSLTLPRDIPAELVQLAEFCTTISGYLHLNDVLPILSQRLQRLVPYSTCTFYIMGNEEDRIAAMHVNGKFSELIRGHVMEIGKGISGWVAAYRRPMINTGPALDFQGLEGDFTSFTDALVVPIVKEDECLGTISLYAQQPISYGQNDLGIMQMVASLLVPLIAEAVKNKAQDTQDVVDPVTGLNRISYLTAIAPQLIARAAENRTSVSLIYVEVRNLAQIIRSFGSSLGNSVLKKIADGIKPEFRETDVLVRYGQQGFVAFLPGVRDDQALRCVQRLKQRIRSEAVTPGQGFSVDCQTGVSFYPRDGSTILALLQSSQENMRANLAEKTASERNVVDFYRA
jgi:diguanylate cyclase (GGDEF)-like protein/putative nucleotidyltransferase with HDIG domain